MIAIVPHDPAWRRHFEAKRVLLERVLAPGLEEGIHHIGSTAVPGIAATPIIDMMVGVRDLEEARAAFEPLRQEALRLFAAPAGHRTPLREAGERSSREFWQASGRLSAVAKTGRVSD